MSDPVSDPTAPSTVRSVIRGRNGMAALECWEQLEPVVPEIVATMRRYLEQIGCVLRPGSVVNTDIALRSFVGFLVETAPEVTCTAQVTRRHVEDYKPWLAKRPGQNKAHVTTATLAHRLGTLRMFFVRIDEWGWDEAPPRVPMFPGDLPRQDHPLPKGTRRRRNREAPPRRGQPQAAAGSGHRRGAAPHRPAGW